MEVELRGVFAAANVACYHTRIPSHPLVTSETLAQMEKDLPGSAGLLPTGLRFGAIGYGCTSGATVIGQDNVAAAVRTQHPTANVTDPISAVIAALRALKAKKIGLLTPYVPEVTTEMRDLLQAEGFEISEVAAFGQSEDRLIARISEASTLAAIEHIGETDCDAVFASCTNLRSFGILEEAEQRIGKPVISSNLALGWHMLQLAGVRSTGCGPGRLFQL
ncbi:MAG: maleate isomerase [Planctomycetota bacterium]|jgi:maleate isomerase